MPVPFIRVYPSGKGSVQEIARPIYIESRAFAFLHAGGWYMIEALPSGRVRLSATDGAMQELAGCQTDNGPGLPDAVDSLVLASQDYITMCRESAQKH